MNSPSRTTRPLLFILAICLATLAAYWQVGGHGFINFDDPLYLTENYQVRQGLTLPGIQWAATASHASNYHPLTWLSHMTDIQFFGLDAGRHHQAGLLLHLINTVLLFWFLNTASGRVGPSAFVSGLFALHPLHVESVAWAAERKDLLSTFFLLLSLQTYLSHSRNPQVKKYLLLCALFICGLLSKPMLVTLPFLLLLLDIWPLGRLTPDTAGRELLHQFHPLFKEKIPLFLFSALSCVITLQVQSQSGAVKPLEMIPLSQRLANSLLSTFVYLKKTFWPLDLAIYYPYPDHIPLWQPLPSLLFLVLISGLVLSQKKKRPFLAVGWFWFLGMLVPVIGLVQVGTQAHADRYTYVPLIGIFIIIAWGMAEYARRRPGPAMLAALATLGCFGFLTWKQVSYWQDSTTLFSHALKVTKKNATAHTYLAMGLAEQGRTAEAEEHYRQALIRNPNFGEALTNLGVLLAGQGDNNQALQLFKQALKSDQNNPKILNNIGNIYKDHGDLLAALQHYEQALAQAPDFVDLLFNTANTMEKLDRFQESIVLYKRALAIFPEMPEAHNGLGVTLARSGQITESIPQFRRALELRPGYRQAEKNLDLAEKTVLQADKPLDEGGHDE